MLSFSPPTPHPLASVLPPPLFRSGGRGTLAGERGGGRFPIPTRWNTLWYSLYEYILYVLCANIRFNFQTKCLPWASKQSLLFSFQNSAQPVERFQKLEGEERTVYGKVLLYYHKLEKPSMSCNPTQLGKQLKVPGTNFHSASQQWFNPPWKEPTYVQKENKFSYSLLNSSKNNFFWI